MSHISDLVDFCCRGIENFTNRFDIKKWITGFIVVHNETNASLKFVVSTTANYKVISDTDMNANAQINASGLSIGGGLHIIYEDAKYKELAQIFHVQKGGKQTISLYEKHACMTILANSPDSPLFAISNNATVIIGRRYYIKQTDFEKFTNVGVRDSRIYSA